MAVYVGQITLADVAPPVAATVAFGVAVTHNYLANRWVTFRRQRSGFASQGARFAVVSTVALGVNLGLLALLLGVMESVAAQLVAVCVAMPVNFLGNKLDRGANLVLQMDCDFSHDPTDIGRLVAATKDADVVLGSRYVPAGAVTDWPLLRRLISRGGRWYARTILGVGIRDLTGGFECFRWEALEALLWYDTRSSGDGFQIEMTHRALRADLRVREVPIEFSDRTLGSSKMSRGIALEAARVVVALRRSPSPFPPATINREARVSSPREV